MAPRKLALSPTKIAAFLECPLKYKLLYIDRIGRFYYRPKPWDTFGSTMHRVLQSFHEPGKAPPSVDGLVAAYRDAWVSAGYADRQEEQEFKKAGDKMLREYYTAAVTTQARTLFTEKTVKSDMGDFVLTGRLDRLDEHPDESLEIIDYKSGLTSVSEEDVRGSLAMGIYQLIVSRLNPGRRVFASVIALAGGVKSSAELSPEELEEVDEGTRRVASSIANSEQYEPRRWDGCEACDFYRLCVKQPWFGGDL